MKQGPLIWGGAFALSGIAHAGAAAVLAWALQPGEVPEQPTPETQMQLAAFQVPRTEAQETAPDADALDADDTEGTQLGQDTIPTTRATPQTPTPDEVTSLAATGQQVRPMDNAVTSLSAVAQTADTLAEATPPSSVIAESVAPVTTLQDATPPSETVGNSPAPATSLASLGPQATTVGTVQPTGAALPATPPQSEAAPVMFEAALAISEQQPSSTITRPSQIEAATAPSRQPAAIDLPDADLPILAAATPEPDTASLAPVSPPTEFTKAALAFQTSGDGPIDPVSLSAFQSFMAPGDLGDAAAEVRDSVTSALSAIPCSRLQARFDPDINTLIMTGHVPEPGLRNTVLQAMQEKMGADIPVMEDLLILPRPQCGALSGISQVGLPQSTDQITNPLLVGAGTHAREFRYVDGQPLVLALQGADYDAYVYVDFFDADGNVLHLAPNDFTPMEQTPAKSSLQIGSERALAPGEPGLFITIGPPYGQEIAVAFAASQPLYDGTRPLVEPAEPYLDWLREQVAAARQSYPDFKGEWVYFFVSTAAQ